ncbi:hypothetical protein EVAR_68053_1 [Eumeta japonica]|uniref:Uncharacterized protein n=1 Tax=Eumeta variegata TaxID=151549 RepID=A0A4C1ZTT1_EUMVA|nr:hypothetical protein EVAR_68053_1 [Eumeta japonica]
MNQTGHALLIGRQKIIYPNRMIFHEKLAHQRIDALAPAYIRRRRAGARPRLPGLATSFTHCSCTLFKTNESENNSLFTFGPFFRSLFIYENSKKGQKNIFLTAMTPKVAPKPDRETNLDTIPEPKLTHSTGCAGAAARECCNRIEAISRALSHPADDAGRGRRSGSGVLRQYRGVYISGARLSGSHSIVLYGAAEINAKYLAYVKDVATPVKWAPTQKDVTQTRRGCCRVPYVLGQEKKLVACKVGIRAKVLRDNDFECATPDNPKLANPNPDHNERTDDFQYNYNYTLRASENTLSRRSRTYSYLLAISAARQAVSGPPAPPPPAGHAVCQDNYRDRFHYISVSRNVNLLIYVFSSKHEPGPRALHDPRIEAFDDPHRQCDSRVEVDSLTCSPRNKADGLFLVYIKNSLVNSPLGRIDAVPSGPKPIPLTDKPPALADSTRP